MCSTDRTVEIARELGATVRLHRGPGFNYAPREFAVSQASFEWVLVVDADELIPIALSRDVRRLAESGEADVVLIPRANYMLGSVIRHTGCGPTQDAQVRLFRKGFVVASSRAHQDFKPLDGARVNMLPYRGDNAIVHFTYLDSQQFVERLNRYTSIEAMQAFERGERITAVSALMKAAKHLGARYIIWKGFQDGWRGLYLSLFYTFYKIVTAAKLLELTNLGSREGIEKWYRHEAEEVLKAYREPQSRAASWSSVGAGLTKPHSVFSWEGAVGGIVARLRRGVGKP